MSVAQSQTEVPKRKRFRFQYSLQTLLAVITASGLLLGLVAWRGELVSRMPEVFLAIGVGLFALGALLRRWAVAALGIVLLAGLALELRFVSPNRPENMEYSYNALFWVQDIQTGKPIANASLCLHTFAVSYGTTDREGRIELVTYREHSSNYTYYDAGLGWYVEATAPGYTPVSINWEHLDFRDGCFVIPMQMQPQGR